MLYDIKRSDSLLDSKKQKFYDLLHTNGSKFNVFYCNQIEVFKQVCSYYIEPYGFSEKEINDLYKTFPVNCLTMEKSEYLRLVESKVKEFNAACGSAKLKKIWFDKTGTDSPVAWSKEYRMPILCMIEDNQMQAAKAAFEVINRKHPESTDTDRAIKFIESAKFYDKLKSEKERDKAFSAFVIKEYAVLLTDINEVKDYLSRVISASPYDWMGLPEVDKKLKTMAEAKYNQSGCVKALEKIDSMNITEVKRYLKELIRDNMTVGIEIIKES